MKADAIAHINAAYGLSLPEDALEVDFSCTVMNSQCQLLVRADARSAGLDRRFTLWPTYQSQGGTFKLEVMDDNLRALMVREPIQRHIEQLLQEPDAPRVTIRVREFNDFVGIEAALPTDVRELAKLDAAALVQRYGKGIGLNVFVYALADPVEFSPRVRDGIERLLSDPSVSQLGHGLDIRWFFRRERLLPGETAAQKVVDADGMWLPSSGPDNTQAKWRLRIGGRAFGDDLDEPVSTLLNRLDKEEPMLTQ